MKWKQHWRWWELEIRPLRILLSSICAIALPEHSVARPLLLFSFLYDLPCKQLKILFSVKNEFLNLIDVCLFKSDSPSPLYFEVFVFFCFSLELQLYLSKWRLFVMTCKGYFLKVWFTKFQAADIYVHCGCCHQPKSCAISVQSDFETR